MFGDWSWWSLRSENIETVAFLSQHHQARHVVSDTYRMAEEGDACSTPGYLLSRTGSRVSQSGQYGVAVLADVLPGSDVLGCWFARSCWSGVWLAAVCDR